MPNLGKGWIYRYWQTDRWIKFETEVHQQQLYKSIYKTYTQIYHQLLVP